jgi:Mn-dependent DtxR family transcriptional regulator
MAKLEMPNKQIMNPMRVKMLQILNERGEKEVTTMYLRNETGCKLDSANRAVERFAEYGLIRFTGGGYFVISEKGKEYLRSLDQES